MRGFLYCHTISIHALRKESDRARKRLQHGQDISIHALRKESDPIHIITEILFIISIHALRKESDMARAPKIGCSLYFNPRSP